jgi:hypothetical protein
LYVAEVKLKEKEKATAAEARKREEERRRVLDQAAAMSPGMYARSCACRSRIFETHVSFIPGSILTYFLCASLVEELIARLSKWKPGQPWPEGIPPPPPGWKPGDALHFDLPKPVIDSGVGLLVKPTSTVAQAKAAPRVVPFVSLDLNPDLEDDDLRSIDDDFEEVSSSDGEDSD